MKFSKIVAYEVSLDIQCSNLGALLLGIQSIRDGKGGYFCGLVLFSFIQITFGYAEKKMVRKTTTALCIIDR